ncbi:Uncharacterised protein [Mycobacteroides abscessus subsp. abscessus]|nr:Uncharacterised protein [Mycobacteroides abscessus subsp. abscessus]
MIEELVEEAAEPGTFRWKFTDDKRRELVRAEGGASIHH